MCGILYNVYKVFYKQSHQSNTILYNYFFIEGKKLLFLLKIYNLFLKT